MRYFILFLALSATSAFAQGSPRRPEAEGPSRYVSGYTFYDSAWRQAYTNYPQAALARLLEPEATSKAQSSCPSVRVSAWEQEVQTYPANTHCDHAIGGGFNCSTGRATYMLTVSAQFRCK